MKVEIVRRVEGQKRTIVFRRELSLHVVVRTEAVDFVGTNHIEVAQTQGCRYSFMNILVEIKLDKKRGVVTHRSSQVQDDRRGALSARIGQ